MGLLTKLQTLVVTPLAATANLITSGLSKITGKTYTKTNAAEEVKNNPLVRGLADVILGGTAALAAVAAAPIVAESVAGAGGAGAVAKKALTSLIPTTTKGKVIAAIAAPVVVGAVVAQPAKTLTAVANAPSNLANFGGNIANLAANPSIAGLKTLAVENPLLTTAAGAAAVATIGGGIGLAANTIATFTNSQSTKANTAATNAGLVAESPSTSNDSGISVTDTSGQMYKILPVGETTPTTAVTHEVKQGTTSKKRKKAIAKALPQNISQRVNVLVNNRSSSVGIKQSKKYINERLLN